jgi:hypothetical protein
MFAADRIAAAPRRARFERPGVRRSCLVLARLTKAVNFVREL